MMKNLILRFLALSSSALAAAAAETIPTPPALAPIANVNAPTAQTPTAESLLAFLPDNLASYGDVVITKQALVNELGAGLEQMARMGRRFSEDELKKVVTDLVNYMVNRDYFLQSAKADGYEPNLADGKTEVEQQRERIGAEQFDAQLAGQGMTLDRLIAVTSERMALDKWMRTEVASTISVSDDEVVAFYEQQPERIRASHILFKVKPDADEATRKIARDSISSVLAKAQQGEDFAELAKQHSHGPSSSRGGDLGFFTKGTMVPAFETAAFALDVDEISDIVETPFGYHIIKLTAKGAPPLDDAMRARITEQLRMEKTQEVMKARHQAWRKTENFKFLF